MNQENKWIALIKEQRLLFILLIMGIVLVVLLILLSSRGQDRTDGDTAAPNSGAFLTYQGETFNPFGALQADNFIRDDIAFFARQTMEVYNPDKNPGVVFVISEYTPANDNKVSFKGKYDKVKGGVTVTAERLAYNRVRVSINWGDTNIDSQLPSASRRNVFISTLPVEQDDYQLTFSEETDLFMITPTVVGDQVIDRAREFLRSQLGEEYSDDSYIFNYPAYLKGEPQYNNTIDDRVAPDEDH